MHEWCESDMRTSSTAVTHFTSKGPRLFPQWESMGIHDGKNTDRPRNDASRRGSPRSLGITTPKLTLRKNWNDRLGRMSRKNDVGALQAMQRFLPQRLTNWDSSRGASQTGILPAAPQKPELLPRRLTNRDSPRGASGAMMLPAAPREQ